MLVKSDFIVLYSHWKLHNFKSCYEKTDLIFHYKHSKKTNKYVNIISFNSKL